MYNKNKSYCLYFSKSIFKVKNGYWILSKEFHHLWRLLWFALVLLICWIKLILFFMVSPIYTVGMNHTCSYFFYFFKFAAEFYFLFFQDYYGKINMWNCFKVFICALLDLGVKIMEAEYWTVMIKSMNAEARLARFKSALLLVTVWLWANYPTSLYV